MVDMKQTNLPAYVFIGGSAALTAGIYGLGEPGRSICALLGFLVLAAYVWFVLKHRTNGQGAIISAVTTIVGPLVAIWFIQRGQTSLVASLKDGSTISQLGSFFSGAIALIIYVCTRAMTPDGKYKRKTHGLDIVLGVGLLVALWVLMSSPDFLTKLWQEGPPIALIGDRHAPDANRLAVARFLLVEFTVWISARSEDIEEIKSS